MSDDGLVARLTEVTLSIATPGSFLSVPLFRNAFDKYKSQLNRYDITTGDKWSSKKQSVSRQQEEPNLLLSYYSRAFETNFSAYLIHKGRTKRCY